MKLNNTPLRLAAIALAFAPSPLAGCADDATAESPACSRHHGDAPPPPCPTRLDVVAREFEWAGIPERLPAGSYPMSFRNEGAEPHEVFVFRNTEGLSLDELAELGPVGHQGPRRGGRHADRGAGRGGPSETTLTLTPGTYEVVCFIPTPTDGLAHFAHGMHRTIEVGLTGSRPPSGRASICETISSSTGWPGWGMSGTDGHLSHQLERPGHVALGDRRDRGRWRSIGCRAARAPRPHGGTSTRRPSGSTGCSRSGRP